MLAKKISREFYHRDGIDLEGIILLGDAQLKPPERLSLLAYAFITLMEYAFHGDCQDSDILKMEIRERLVQSDA